MSRKFTFTTQVYDKRTDFPATGDVDVIYIDASKNTAYRYDLDYYTISSAEVDIWGALGSLSKGGGGGGGASWGSISGTLSSQTDLNTALNAKQNTLVSATNIKTINGNSILGSGDLVVSATANPSVIALNATDGTAVTGTTTETISRSLLIPANTYTGNGMLEVLARMTKTGALGTSNMRIYKNTSNTLTGATLIASTGSNTAAIVFNQAIRNFRINSNTLSGFSANSSQTFDYASSSSALSSTTFTTNVDNYILFSIQLANILDSANVSMARVTKSI